MPAENPVEPAFDLIAPRRGPAWARTALSGLNALCKKVTGLAALQAFYGEIRAMPGDECFTDKILAGLNVRVEVGEGGHLRIPRTGPLVVVANHPFGGVEAAALASLLLAVRPDVKFLANHMLSRAPELNDLILPVDPFHSRDSARFNLASMKKAIRWIRSGGLLAIFPAGKVAHYQISRRGVSDPAWQVSIGQLIRTLNAPVLPVYFPGRNGLFFQLAGLAHPLLRTGLLVREFLNKRGCVLAPRVGRPIPAAKLKELPSDEELINYLRHRTYLLAAREDCVSETLNPPPAPVIPPPPRETLQREVETLPQEQKLWVNGKFEVYRAGYDQIPRLMEEIGRLREMTFREAGEGTGRSCDLDEFDTRYVQLFLWNREKCELVGAYRLGLSDLILAGHGKDGFYTSRLFDYPERLIAAISPGIELGRSFVRLEYQRSYLPLLLLWRGIGSFLIQKPWYRYLFGAVSMSSRYQPFSRELLVSHLSLHYDCAELSRLVRGRLPLRRAGLKAGPAAGLSLRISGFEELSEIISDLEPDAKGLPVLFRKYLELGGRFLAFHQDGDFHNALDGLVLVDLPRSNPRVLEFYMGRGGAARYLGYHGVGEPGREAWERASGLPPQGPREWQPAPLS